jgi:thiamine-phosphate pyrophosphorylase
MDGTASTRKPSLPLLLCYISDRAQFPGGRAQQELCLLKKIAECAAAGVDYIQLREKDLTSRDLEALVRKAVAALPADSQAKLLINARADVALACGAHGVHLPANDLAAGEVRTVFVRAGNPAAVIGVSAHSVEEVRQAEARGADFVAFGPVFEKNGQMNPQGLKHLRQACQRAPMPSVSSSMPILALGGVTLENAQQCLAAGAVGIAAIRLFQENDVEQTVDRLRSQFAP